MKGVNANWPEDADGDVFRRLAQSGFDFEARHRIDFNVDIASWPPAPELLARLQATYPGAECVAPETGSPGYITFVVENKLSYALVMFVQQSVSELAAPFGGRCESWGVLRA